MEALIDNILNHELIIQLVNFINSLGNTEIKLIVAITAVLILFIVYRKFGVGAFWALTILFFILFIVYQANIFGFYKKQSQEQVEHLQEINAEL
jgi:uncharacterized membrane protein YcfT